MKTLILSIISFCLLQKNVQADPRIAYDEKNGGYTVRLERIPVNSSSLRKPKYPENLFGENLPKKPEDIMQEISQQLQNIDEELKNEVKSLLKYLGVLKDTDPVTRSGSMESIMNHPRVKADTRRVLTNILNTMYFGPIYIGTPSQSMLLVYDTGSDWLTVEESSCSNCLKQKFDNKLSSTWQNASLGISQRKYGSASLFGYEATDRVSLDAGAYTQVDNFKHFEITSQLGINEYIDGILGMSRKWVSNNYTTGPLFIEFLYNKNKISNKMFSFYMTDKSKDSFVDIGFMDQARMLGGSIASSGFIWMNMPKDTSILFWFGRATAIRFGDETNPQAGNYSAFALDNPISAVFDTGTSMVSVPKQVQKAFFTNLLRGQRYVSVGGMYQISCANKDQFPSIYLAIEGYWLEIHPKDYVLEIDTSGTISCLLGFAGGEFPFWLLGDAFLRGYYTVHDMTNDRIGFAPHDKSYKKIITTASQKPTATISQDQTNQSWLLNVDVWRQIIFGWIWVPLLCCVFYAVTFCFALMVFLIRLMTIGNNITPPNNTYTSEIKDQSFWAKISDPIVNLFKSQNQNTQLVQLQQMEQ